MKKILTAGFVVSALLFALVNPASATREPEDTDVVCSANNYIDSSPFLNYVILSPALARQLWAEDGKICDGFPKAATSSGWEYTNTCLAGANVHPYNAGSICDDGDAVTLELEDLEPDGCLDYSLDDPLPFDKFYWNCMLWIDNPDYPG